MCTKKFILVVTQVNRIVTRTFEQFNHYQKDQMNGMLTIAKVERA